MENNENMELLESETPKRSLFGVYFKIILAPLAIFVLFLLGFLGVINFKVETHSIVMITILAVIALVLAKQNAEYGCAIFENESQNFKKELKNFIISNILIIGQKRKSKASFSEFSALHTKNLRNENYSSIAASIFPMLGILGTFISIAISMPEFSSKNINALETEIAQLLSGVGTAFYVSIYGIFLAIWWLYFEKKGISRFEKILHKYENSTKEFFWSESEITHGYLAEILNKNEKMANNLNSMLGSDFSDKMEVALKQKFCIFNEILDTQIKASQSAKDELEKFASFIDKADLKGTIENYAKMNENLKTITTNLLDIQNLVAAEYVNLSQYSANKVEAFEERSKILAQNLSDFSMKFESLKEEILSHESKISHTLKSELNSYIKEFDEVLDENK